MASNRPYSSDAKFNIKSKTNLKLKESNDRWNDLLNTRKLDVDLLRKKFWDKRYQNNYESKLLQKSQIKSLNKLQSYEFSNLPRDVFSKSSRQFYQNKIKLYQSLVNLYNKEMIKTENDAMRIGYLFKHFEKITSLKPEINKLEISKRNNKAYMEFYGFVPKDPNFLDKNDRYK